MKGPFRQHRSRVFKEIAYTFMAWACVGFLHGPLPLLQAQDEGTRPTAAKPNEKAAKYHSALRRRPSGGYLFDRFYNAWLDTGTIDGMGGFLKKQAGAGDATTADRLLLGYYLAHQGREAEALSVFETALEADPKNAEAWAELAKARARTLDFDKAVGDLEKALASNPKEELAIRLGKLKGRWLSRSGKNEEALAAWRDLLERHPKDSELREDLVDLQLAESLIEEAILTQSALIESTSDPYQKITRKLRLGDIYLRSGKNDKAKETYSESLKAAGRDTWLEKEILAQIESLFRRENNLEGLKKYYAELAEKDQGRIALRRRHAVILAELEEGDEALAVFREILKMTPGDQANREAYVSLLGKLGKAKEAVEQINVMVQAQPDNPELLTQLAAWQNEAKQPDAARQSIEKYLKSSDGSEYSHLRAARMLEQFKQAEAAGEIFDQLVATFPDSVSAREERAAFLYRTDKKEEAVAIWKKIAGEGSDQDAIRAARILSSHGQRETAYQILKKRADEFATDFVFLGRLCEEAIASGHAGEAIPWMEKRIALATAPADLREALRQSLSILDRSEKLGEYREQLSAGRETLGAPQSCLLAELLERNGEYDLAETVLQPWMDKGNLLALHQRSRQLELRNEWAKSAELMRKLVALPEGRRSTNLQRLVNLYQRAQNPGEAVKWIDEWKKISPGSSQPWLEQAKVLNNDGKSEEAIQVLRKTVARFEDEEAPRTLLASYYQQQGNAADAERIYWNLYDESEDVGAKLRWVASLASTARQQGQIEKLIERFEERRRANRNSIAPLLAIAEVHRQSGDYEGRRAVLLEATRLRPEDLNLLKQIARIEEQEGDWERAVETLESALPLDKSDGTRRDIALLYLRYGDEEVAYRKFMELRGGADMDADSVLAMADSMIARSGWKRAIELLDSHRERFPDDYRIAYLRGVALEESGEDKKAIEAFIHLLDFEKEIGKTPPTNQPNYFDALTADPYIGKSPQGLADLFQIQGAAYMAFQHRQQMQSGRIQFQNSFGGTGTSLVRLPASLSELGNYALAHLRQLSLNLLSHEDDPDKENMIALALEQRGFKDVQLMLALPTTNFYNFYSSGTQYDVDLLDRFPDSDALHAMVVLGHANMLRNQAAGFDFDTFARCYQKLQPEYPDLALGAALCAAASTDEGGVALLRKALAETPRPDKPAGIVYSSVSYLLLNHTDKDFPADLKKSLMQLLQDWREAQLAELAKDNNSNLLARFNPGDPYLAILRKSEDPAAFATYLDGQCAEYEKALQGTAGRGTPISQSSLAPYLQYLYRSQAMLNPLSFPPVEIPGIAPNVLICFVETPGFSFGFENAPLDPERARTVVEKVADPILKAFFLNLSGDAKATGQHMESILTAASKDRERPPLREALLGAAWYQKTGQWEKAAGLLESVRLLPMSNELRRRIDAQLVVCARDADLKEEDFKADDAKGLAKWGPAAALRLRYGFLSSQKRAELVNVLQEFGYQKESEQLDSNNLKLSSHPGGMIPSQSAGAQGIREQIDKLVEDGKPDQAEKLLTRTLEQNTRSLVANGNVVWEYNLLNLVNSARRKHSQMLAKIYRQAKPGKEAKADDYIRYAGLLEIDVRFEEASKAYDTALGMMTESSRNKYRPRVAFVKGIFAPEEAAELLEQINPQQLTQIVRLIDTVARPIDYSDEDSNKRFVARLNQTRMITAWLLANQDNKNFARMDLGWVMHSGLRKISDNMHPLPSIHKNDRFSLRSPADKDPQLERQRRVAYDGLCKAMARYPQLAWDAFSSLASLRIAEGNGEAGFNDPELLALAEQILENSPKNPPVFPGQSYYNSYPLSEYSHPRWPPDEYLIQRSKINGKGEEEAQKIVAKVGRSRNHLRTKSSEAFAQLLFGQPGAFDQALKGYLASSSGNTPMSPGYYSSSATTEAFSAATKAFAIWKNRQPQLDGSFDMEAFINKAVKESRQTLRNEALLLAADYTEWLAGEKGWQATENWLLKITETWLGDRSQWEKFRKEARRKVPTGSGGYYYQGGQYTNLVHQQYAAFIGRCGANPSLAFNIVAFAEKHGLEHEKQVLESTVLSRLDSSSVTKNPQLVLSIFRNSPFVASPAHFRSGQLQADRDSLFEKFLDASGKWDSVEQEKFRGFLKTKNTFGANLALAYLDKAEDITVFLGTQRKQIETMPKPGQLDLASLLARIHPNGVPVDGLDGDSLAVIDHLGAERAKSAVEEAQAFLSVKSLPSIDIGNSRELRKKLGPLLDPLLKAKEWDLMENVYWHAIDLAKVEQKKGTWSVHYNLWNLDSSVLYELLQTTPGGGLERIAFYQRMVRNDSEGRMGVVCSTSRFNQYLKTAFKEAGDLEKTETALNSIAHEVWELSGGGDKPSLSGLFWMDLLQKFPPSQMPQLIAWADKHSKGEAWSPLAKEIAMSWRMAMRTSTRMDIKPYWDEVPNFDSWQAHYLGVLNDETLSVPWRISVASELCDGAPDVLEPETVYRCSELMAEALLDGHHFSSWAFFYIIQEFCLLPKNDRWVALAEKIHEGWVFRNRFNSKDPKFGQSWTPGSEIVLQSLEFHCKLGDREKLNQFRKEAHAAKHLRSTARTVFCLVQHGFFDEAVEELKRNTNFQDIKTDYVDKTNAYKAYYDSKAHKNLPKFLDKIDQPGLRYFAEILVLGAFDLPKERKEKDAEYSSRSQRILEVGKRFAEIDFEGDEILKGNTLRQFDLYDHNIFYLRKELAAHNAKADLDKILTSKNYRRIEYDTRPLGSHANNRLREQDLIPVRKFLQTLRQSKARDYYRGKALEHFSLRIAFSVPFRSHHAMTPENLQAHADALHLLLALPDDKLMSHQGMQETVLAKVAADVLLGQFPETESQLETNKFSGDRIKVLGKALYKDIYEFWRPITVVMKFKSSDPRFLPGTEERHRRVEALLAHPLIKEGLKNERNLHKILEHNAWVTKEEFDSAWGKSLMESWTTTPAEK